MDDKKRLICNAVLMGFMVISVLLPLSARGAENAAMVIEQAKAAIEQARQAGAEKKAPDVLSQAKSWLSQAEKEYADSQSILSRTMKMVVSNEVKSREISYLATMAMTKGLIAEAKSKKITVAEELKGAQKDLADYRTSLEVLNRKLAEAEAAKEVQAKAEAELKDLEQAKQKAVELEAQKRMELEDVQRKSAEIEALKQQDRLQEAQRVAAREKELAEARIRTEKLALQKEKDDAELKAKEQQMAMERQKMEAMQKKMAALEKEKAMLADAAKILQTTVKSTDREIVISLPTINIFSSKNEIHSQGKAILDEVGAYLKKYSIGKIAIRSYTDSTGTAAVNQSLSEKRAQKVKEYIVVYQNISSAEVTVEGFGSTQPVASNSTEAGRALNRRVEIGIPTSK
ncbi:MAG: OmpA family protein [Pseudomonadota bacterium]